MARKRSSQLEASNFFTRMYSRTDMPEGFVEMRVFDEERKGKVLCRTWVDHEDEFQKVVNRFTKDGIDAGVYYGVALRKEAGDGTKENCIGSHVLWAEIDFVKMGWDEMDTIRKLHDLPDEMRPSACIHSGRGLHLYWMLDEPLYDHAQIEDANKVLCDFMSSDNIWNVDRILRVPGSFNCKNKGRERCRVIWFYQWHKHDVDTLIDAVLSFGHVLYDGQWITPEEAKKRDQARIKETQKNAFQYAMEDRRKTTNARGERIWDRCVYHGGPGTIGIDEASMLYTSYLYCRLKDPDERQIESIVERTLKRIESVYVRDAAEERWDWNAEERKVRKQLARWIPKWEAIKAANKARNENEAKGI